MMKNLMFAVALLSLALTGGCAKGGNGTVPPPVTVTVAITSPSNANPGAIYPSQSLTLTATVANSTNTAVTWSLTGPGTLTPITPATNPATATYVAPTTVPATGATQPTVTATLASDTSITGPLALTIVDITSEVTPATVSAGTTGGPNGTGLTQQFTAVAVPDDAPQSFTWTCSAGGTGNACANFVPVANTPPQTGSSGLALYTADDTCTGNCVQISAVSTLDSGACNNNPNCTVAKVSLVQSRVSGTYAFQFSGYNATGFVAVAGTFTVAAGGSISGVEDQLTSSGTATNISIAGGSYTPTKSDAINSNNAGTLSLPPANGIGPSQYQAVLDGTGGIQMIESDLNGTGSGVAQKASSAFSGTVEQTYAFGFTGVDSGGNRVGYAGLMGFNGTGGLSGLMDVNDNGQGSNSICSPSAAPCTITGTYTQNNNGSWHLALTKPVIMGFDFFISSGTTGKTSPLTFYAISTDPIATNPVVAGTMVLQDSTQTYNNAAFKGISVSALTGTGTGANGTIVPKTTNVSLTLGTTDGNGNFSGQFDQNNDGVILSSVQFPPKTGTNNYTYTSTGTPPSGRYTFNMLGNPTASPVGAPLPFVLYASGANRGFQLDTSSASVMTGAMNPQGKGGETFANSELPGTYAAATTSSGSSEVVPLAANLLMTYPGIVTPGTPPITVVAGTQYQYPNPGQQTVAGTYTLTLPGTGTIPLTAPSGPSYVIYVLDTSGCGTNSLVCSVQDFLMIDEDKTNLNPSIIFAQQ
ncbi:MAG: hypothetical protein ABSD76_19410 [Terriglobales bacterium]|jgi:hypothetical protein